MFWCGLLRWSPLRRGRPAEEGPGDDSGLMQGAGCTGDVGCGGIDGNLFKHEIPPVAVGRSSLSPSPVFLFLPPLVLTLSFLSSSPFFLPDLTFTRLDIYQTSHNIFTDLSTRFFKDTAGTYGLCNILQFLFPPVFVEFPQALGGGGSVFVVFFVVFFRFLPTFGLVIPLRSVSYTAFLPCFWIHAGKVNCALFI